MSWLVREREIGALASKCAAGVRANRAILALLSMVLYSRRGVRVVYGAALEKRCAQKVPGVRIPPSPPRGQLWGGVA